MMKKFLTAILAIVACAATYAGMQVVSLGNGDMENENTLVYVKSNVGGNSAITLAEPQAGVGVNGSKGISIATQSGAKDPWDAQFWINFGEVEEGTELSVSFDYKADAAAKVSSQGHTTPGNYTNNNGVGDLNFTTEWKHYEGKVTVAGGNNGVAQSIAFNLCEDKNASNVFYLDNVSVSYEKFVDEGEVFDWVDVTAAEHTQKIAGAFSQVTPDENGVITVVCPAKAENGNAWDSQFWMVMKEPMTKGNFKVSFEAKASQAVSCGTGYHGVPNGNNWQAGGPSVSFETEWKTFELDLVANTSNNVVTGTQSFAFDLSQAAEVTYDFKNIKIEAWQEIELVPEVEPALVCGEEEYGLNTHSIVTVESASAITANILNCPQAIGASYNINVMNMGQDDEGIFWSVGQEIAAGEMSLSGVAYAELEKPINFEAGKKYQLAITVYGQPASDPVEVGTYYFEFAGSYIAPEPIVPAFSELATDTELYLYNVETGAFLLGANDWNTRASVSTSKGYKFQVKANGETYVLSNYVETKNGWYDMFAEGAAGIYVDHASQANWDNWTITSNGDATYQIANKGYANVLFGATDDIAADSRCYLNEKSVNTTWAFVAPADYESYLQAVKDAKGYLAVVASSECKAGADELDGKTFVIVDAATCDNLLCNIGDAHDMAAKSLASLDGSEYIYTKFAKVEKDGVEGNLYTMQMFTADGKNFSKWGSNGYVNFQPAGGNIVFSLGLGNAGVYGQDCENGGLWDVQKDGDNYVIRNVARDTYFNPSAASCGTAEKTAVKLFGKAAFVKPEPTPAEIAVLPSLLAGEEEIALNDHSEATVESAEAVAVSFEGVVPFGASYSISTLKQAATAEGTQWVADQKVASGMMSLSGKAYAEFDKTVVFEQGTKYQLEIVWRNVEGIIIGSAQFIINGAYAPEPTFVEVDLTRDMFHEWDSYEANGNIVGAGGCDYQIGVSTGMPYGNASVIGAQYADLSEYNTLSLTVTEGTPRLLLNRPGMGGDQPGFIEINNANSEYVLSTEDGVWVIDLAKIVEKAGYAHLNVIKGANWANVTITSMKLTKLVEVDPEEPVEPAEMTVTPSLFAGFEDLEAAYAGELGTEYTLNTHSLVSVDVAEGLHVEVANCPEAIGVTFMLNEMLQGQDEDVTFWHVGKELAVGEINMKLDSYAAFEAPITFYAGTKYQLTVTVFAEVNGEPAEISTTTYQFNGASAPVNGSVADGINSIELNSVNGKFIKNGKVVIVKNGKTYNVNGVQVK